VSHCPSEYITGRRKKAYDRVKPFDDLLYFPTTLGMESATDSRRSKLDPEGLCVCPFVTFNVCEKKDGLMGRTQLLLQRQTRDLWIDGWNRIRLSTRVCGRIIQWLFHGYVSILFQISSPPLTYSLSLSTGVDRRYFRAGS
jgi:hypothetical protein